MSLPPQTGFRNSEISRLQKKSAGPAFADIRKLLTRILAFPREKLPVERTTLLW